MSVIPEDSPSNPSIRLIALVIPTIHPIVNIYTKIILECKILSKKAIFVLLILIPNVAIIIAEITCPINFTIAGSPFTSSI